MKKKVIYLCGRYCAPCGHNFLCKSIMVNANNTATNYVRPAWNRYDTDIAGKCHFCPRGRTDSFGKGIILAQRTASIYFLQTYIELLILTEFKF